MQALPDDASVRERIDKCQKLAPVRLTHTVTLGPRQAKCVKAETEDGVYANTPCIEIEKEELVEFDGDDNAISTYTERGSLPENLTEVPEWERLFNIDNPAMTDVMKDQLREVLRSASGVMPTKDTPLGRCNLVKHKINTADSAPI
ncbi:hypothetical protein RvY_02827 [Ramazzottius varieornatus]|uniref:Uncharacterized protein n=1 Tax=Ramazzottius varieornatus TaxID=947166 RepID=A0A1D1UPG7_RAMVA|nr:hypothetical protein RvY_02827 [Ramazzottius varieornatus]